MKSGMKFVASMLGACALLAAVAACGGEKGTGDGKPAKQAAAAETGASSVSSAGETPSSPASATPTTDTGKTKTLNFPSDRSLGELRYYNQEKAAWVVLGEARGTVAAPEHAGITLIVSAEGAKDLSPLSTLASDSLRQIVLDGMEIADGQLDHIKNLKGLQKISFRAAQVSDAGVAPLGSLEGLMEIDFAMTPITDAAMKPLVNLKQLDTLDISATEVGDAAIPDITAITSLRTLDPQRSKITPEGVDKIGKALPDCTIVVR